MEPFGRKSERIQHLNPGKEKHKTLVDISTGGACCFSSLELKADAAIVVTISGSPFRATVKYCRKGDTYYRVGMEFSGLDQAQKKEIQELVERFSRGVPIACAISEDMPKGK